MLDHEFREAVREAQQRRDDGQENDDDRRMLKLAVSRGYDEGAKQWPGNSSEASQPEQPPIGGTSDPGRRATARTTGSRSRKREASGTAPSATTSGPGTGEDPAQPDAGTDGATDTAG